ncbi:hypothetical protein PMIT1312_01327 [Prochlorococcus marinus str. MIT 1312]|nr:hypothetical protein PMIT1312_01327 [Prochlorococcus marinus str. MIT 1312]
MVLHQALPAVNKYLLLALMQYHPKGLERIVNRFVGGEAQDQHETDLANSLKQELINHYCCRLQDTSLCKERLKLLFPSELLLSRLSDRQPWG